MKALLCLLLVLAGDAFADGLRAYREGRYREALAAFSEAVAEAGEGAAPELLYNQALSAVRVGELAVAEAAAERAAARGGPAFAALRDFLIGNIAFQRALTAELQATGPEAEPFAFDGAIAFAKKALRSWQRAAVRKEDWPRARRNVERALRKLSELQRKKDEAAGKKPKKERDPQAEEQPEDPTDPSQRIEEEVLVEPLPAPPRLSARQLQELLDLLATKEKEKRAVRSARQRTPGVRVEKDW